MRFPLNDFQPFKLRFYRIGIIGAYISLELDFVWGQFVGDFPNLPIKAGLSMEFAMAGNYSTLGIQQLLTRRVSYC